MLLFNSSDQRHVDIVVEAAEQAWLNVAGISEAVGESLADEGIHATEEAYSIGLAAAREFRGSVDRIMRR